MINRLRLHLMFASETSVAAELRLNEPSLQVDKLNTYYVQPQLVIPRNEVVTIPNNSENPVTTKYHEEVAMIRPTST